MHYEKTGDMIKAGINLIRKINGASQQKAFSWLLGYTSHVITDVTIHPVIELNIRRTRTSTEYVKCIRMRISSSD